LILNGAIPDIRKSEFGLFRTIEFQTPQIILLFIIEDVKKIWYYF